MNIRIFLLIHSVKLVIYFKKAQIYFDTQIKIFIADNFKTYY